VSNKVPNEPRQGLHRDYDYANASESERWHFDMGFESGHKAALDPAQMDFDDMREMLEVIIEALRRMIEQEKQRQTRGRIEFEGAVIELPDETEENR
jgi:hypothetical protein